MTLIIKVCYRLVDGLVTRIAEAEVSAPRATKDHLGLKLSLVWRDEDARRGRSVWKITELNRAMAALASLLALVPDRRVGSAIRLQGPAACHLALEVKHRVIVGSLVDALLVHDRLQFTMSTGLRAHHADVRPNLEIAAMALELRARNVCAVEELDVGLCGVRASVAGLGARYLLRAVRGLSNGAPWKALALRCARVVHLATVHKGEMAISSINGWARV